MAGIAGLNGYGLNGAGLNGYGLNGAGLNGYGLNGHGLNGLGSTADIGHLPVLGAASSLPVGGISGLGGATNTFGTIPATGLGIPIPVGAGAEGAIIEEEETVLGFFKKLPLPLLLLLLPLTLAAVVAVIVAVIRVSFFVFFLMFPNKKKQETTTEYPYEYQQESQYPPDYQGAPYDSAKARRRRSNSGSPTLTYGQIEKLTSVVYSALRSEECIQRILCEAGTMTRSLPNAKKILKSVKEYVPESLKASYEIFASEGNCIKFSCGPLPFKK